MRYTNEGYNKTNGVVYTPRIMADYLSHLIISHNKDISEQAISILDPAIGDGELIISLVKYIIKKSNNADISVMGFETDISIIKYTKERILTNFPNIKIEIKNEDFTSYALKGKVKNSYDFIIANPPYIRTQILGAKKAQEIALNIGLTGRVDLYYAFLLFAVRLLKDNGIAGFITSNKFMTIKSGTVVRDYLIRNAKIFDIIDFGDTKLFNAAVLPCMIVFTKGKTQFEHTKFTSIYETFEKEAVFTNNIFKSISTDDIISTVDGRQFEIKHGNLAKNLNGSPWSLSSKKTCAWLEGVNRATWKKFNEIGKIKVGIKTTADNVFIKENWTNEQYIPELLYPLITHRNAGQILSNGVRMWQVLYPHTVINQKKIAFDINNYPNTKKYLEIYREQLEARNYIKEAHRNWYEIWVPQNPAAWKNKKIVFRDIVEIPQFWLDNTGAIVNGDCYWIDIFNTTTEDTILLALAVANSNFIEKYYDIKFNNKLYAGKRRYMSQYVEDFPIPNPEEPLAQEAINLVRLSIENKKLLPENKNKIDAIVETLFS
ncbi:MAG: N-6 DNA methylase [Treponema sp.]|jgi:type I restriction-modification system DNA methylase subunit|nr:N-6 DNA methylase [Treponema sp.]